MNAAPILLPLPPVLAPQSGGADPPPQVVADARWSHGCCVLALTGEIDYFSAEWVRAALTTAAAGGGPTRVVVDVSRVSFCDSGLLRALLPWRTAQREVRLAAPSEAVRRLLAVACPRDLPPCHGSVEQALSRH